MIRLAPEQVEWLRATYRDHPLVETTARFNAQYGENYQPSSLKGAFPFYGIKSGRSTYMTRAHPRAWNPEHVDWLRAHRDQYLITELTDAFNAHFGQTRNVAQVQATLDRYRIASPRTGNFRQGQVPWNKGRKGYHFAGSVPHYFQPGAPSIKSAPLGTRVRHDGLWRVKVAESPGPGLSRFGWAYLHHQIWEAAHGPRPARSCIVFVDGDHDHLDLANLALLSRAELARLNQLGWRHLTDPDTRRAMIAQCRLLTAAHQLARARGLDLPTRTRLLPATPKIRPSAGETAPCS